MGLTIGPRFELVMNTSALKRASPAGFPHGSKIISLCKARCTAIFPCPHSTALCNAALRSACAAQLRSTAQHCPCWSKCIAHYALAMTAADAASALHCACEGRTVNEQTLKECHDPGCHHDDEGSASLIWAGPCVDRRE